MIRSANERGALSLIEGVSQKCEECDSVPVESISQPHGEHEPDPLLCAIPWNEPSFVGLAVPDFYKLHKQAEGNQYHHEGNEDVSYGRVREVRRRRGNLMCFTCPDHQGEPTDHGEASDRSYKELMDLCLRISHLMHRLCSILRCCRALLLWRLLLKKERN